ncbi:IS30 family transposase [Rubritalea sp.]|uniref:IS30 family transposase n=1 Tax=Rubritalea sp. TaxID=2109375 RepID=UPI003EF28744
MSHYKHLSREERSILGHYRLRRLSLREIARRMNRNVSTISRELERNRYTNGRYVAHHAQSYYQGRLKRSRKGTNFSSKQWRHVITLLELQFSPEQISGRLKLEKALSISHETIYKYIWADKKHGGKLYKQLRGSSKQRRKRYSSKDSRGRLAGKKMIDVRPPEIEKRLDLGHWEIDTVHGSGKKAIVTLVERATGYVMIGQLDSKKVVDLNARTSKLIRRKPQHFKTITADNGVEFHGYKKLEKRHDLDFYFAFPYHSWERGTNENTNGLIRQYLPKGCSMENLTQRQCHFIEHRLNNRPRKRYNYMTPKEMLAQLDSVALSA